MILKNINYYFATIFTEIKGLTNTTVTLPLPGPPSPASVSSNIFPSRIPQILLSLFPNLYTLSTLLMPSLAVLSQSSFLSVFSSLPTDTAKQLLQSKCQTTNLLYQYLEDEIVLNGDNGTIVTQSLLQLSVCCKPDCNFERLLSVPSAYTGGYSMSNANYNSAVDSFIQTILKYLPSQAATKCRNQYTSLVSSLAYYLNASNPTPAATSIAVNPGLSFYIFFYL
jgi:hypothetical protein